MERGKRPPPHQTQESDRASASRMERAIRLRTQSKAQEPRGKKELSIEAQTDSLTFLQP